MGALGVALGAIGAHKLKPILEAYNKVGTFDTASKYHMFHVIAILLITLYNKENNKFLNITSVLFSIGIVLFSFSLYAISILPSKGFDVHFINYITPFGGVSFIVGWLFISIFAIKSV